MYIFSFYFPDYVFLKKAQLNVQISHFLLLQKVSH